MKYEEHVFYCMNCGRKGIPLMRKSGFQHERFHRKKLYCPFCKMEVNHVECKTYADVEEFKENFEKGVYRDEAEESISYVRSGRERKNYVGA
jgi:uncharacterized Zn finger protein (UPF0148 family)